MGSGGAIGDGAEVKWDGTGVMEPDLSTKVGDGFERDERPERPERMEGDLLKTEGKRLLDEN